MQNAPKGAVSKIDTTATVKTIFIKLEMLDALLRTFLIDDLLLFTYDSKALGCLYFVLFAYAFFDNPYCSSTNESNSLVKDAIRFIMSPKIAQEKNPK